MDMGENEVKLSETLAEMEMTERESSRPNWRYMRAQR